MLVCVATLIILYDITGNLVNLYQSGDVELRHIVEAFSIGCVKSGTVYLIPFVPKTHSLASNMISIFTIFLRVLLTLMLTTFAHMLRNAGAHHAVLLMPCDCDNFSHFLVVVPGSHLFIHFASHSLLFFNFALRVHVYHVIS